MRGPLDDKLMAALHRRSALLREDATTAWRLFHGDADGIPGLVIEQLADVLVCQLHEERLRMTFPDLQATIDRLRGHLGARAVYRKVFVRDRAKVPDEVTAELTSAVPWLGEPVEPDLQVFENALRFLIRPYDGFSVGLFLEHRQNRATVRSLAAGRRVLNTFSYTCGFSVAAAAGGAASVDSVDLHKRYLEWGKLNFQANGLDPAAHRFFASDTFEFYRRAARQGRRYDLIVLDPPTFSRSRRPARVFVLAEQLAELLSGAVALLDPGGLILLATNDRGIPAARLEAELHAAAGPRRCTILDRPALPPDFAGDPDFSKTVIARFA